jgi:[FeFe] hydrogenase H-cluster maturation GTPase HydF
MAKGRENQPHIGIFGKRNAGKSSLINAIANQDVSIVSELAGTTTDPVKKSFEIPGIGPCVLIDTAGIDDVGAIGNQRIERTLKIIDIIDLAVLVIDGNAFGDFEIDLINRFKDYDIPFIIVHNKSDLQELTTELKDRLLNEYKAKVIDYSTVTNKNLEVLLQELRVTLPESIYQKPQLLGDLIKYGDIVLLITPIDAEAPEGRLILPQVQTIRDILDNDAIALVMKEREVDVFFKTNTIKPALAVTDSSFFLKADASIPKDIPLTGFSVLLARYKGDFAAYLDGTPKIDNLKDGDRILLLESCSHHVSCDDIARVKIPRWLSSYTGKSLEYDIVAGLDKLPRPITEYAMLIQCGGCMVTKRQLQSRLKPAKRAGIPITNYGMAIAYMQGIYNRAIQPFMKTSASSDDYI